MPMPSEADPRVWVQDAIKELDQFREEFQKHKHCQFCGKSFLTYQRVLKNGKLTLIPLTSLGEKEIYCSKACSDSAYIRRYGMSTGLQTTQPVGVPAVPKTLPAVNSEGEIPTVPS